MPLIKGLAEKAVAGGHAEALEDAAVLLYGEARILDGEAPDERRRPRRAGRPAAHGGAGLGVP